MLALEAMDYEDAIVKIPAFAMAISAYQIQDGTACWRGTPIKGADIATFQILNATWARDITQIYHHAKPLREADPSTFQVLNHLFAKDRNHVYYMSGIVKDAHAPSFRVFDAGLHSFTLYSRELAECFTCDQKSVFHYTATIGKPCKIPGADVASFAPLKGSYARDNKSVYFENARVKGADPSSIELLNPFYSRDKRAVYALDSVVERANRETFTTVGHFTAKDRFHVFYRGMILGGADSSRFRLLDDSEIFATDGSRIYAHGKPFEVADANSFESLGGCYYRDCRQVYFQAKPISGADPRTFKVIKPCHGIDATAQYRSNVRTPLR